MVEIVSDTEKKILESARKVFIQKGLYGARMQEIADEAGINKALLHYYFRTKDKLFEQVFKETLSNVFPVIATTMGSDMPLYNKLEIFVETYLELLLKNPFIPTFLINEINRDPQIIKNYFGEMPVLIEKEAFGPFSCQLEEEIRKGNIRPIDPRNLVVNILALCLFPVIGKPIIKLILFRNSDEEYNSFLADRKKQVFDFIWNSISLK